MKSNDVASWAGKDKNFLIAHYNEVGEESRLYDRLLWELPSIAIAIASGLLITSYVVTSSPVLSLICTALATIWVFVMIIAAKKHEYFVSLQKARLMTLEENGFSILNLQRVTNPDKTLDVPLQKTHWKKPKKLQCLSAHLCLNCALWITFIGSLVLTISNLIKWVTC